MYVVFEGFSPFLFIFESARETMFKDYHPIVNVAYFTFSVGLTALSNDPRFILLSLFFSWAYSVILKGRKMILTNILMIIPIMIIMAVINTFFTHNGATVLFFINDMRITLEALIYGIFGALTISAVIIWFICFSEVMSSDKLIYIFGKTRPVLGLTLSMIFRFIPLLKERFNEIRLGQICMKRAEDERFFGKIRQFVKEISILISWSLESAIETADSMESRGYGLRGRTSFHLFKFSARDKQALAIISILGFFGFVACISGKTDIFYYPEFSPVSFDLMRAAAFLSHAALFVIPLIIDLRGKKKWQLSR